MTIAPGPFAPTVTQWVAGTPTTDTHGDEVPAFTSRSVRVLAEYPAGSGDQPASTEVDNATGHVVTAAVVLLLEPSTTVSAKDEWTATDGVRYRTLGAPGRFLSPFTGTAVTQVNLRRIS